MRRRNLVVERPPPKHRSARGPKGVSDELLAAALRANLGSMTYAAKALGISVQAVSQRIQKNLALQEACREAKVVIIDVCQGQVAKACHAGDMKTIRWTLDRLGRDRGYGATRPHEEQLAPPDPAFDQKRQSVLTALTLMLEERARGGRQPVMIDVTPPRPHTNGSGGLR